MSYEAYKLIHLLGIFLLLTSLAGMAVHAVTGKPKAENPVRRPLTIFHGLGALVTLTGAFGLLARLGVDHGELFPGWVWAKLALWLLLGGAVALPYRSSGLARALIFALPLLGALGALLANLKPF